MALDPRIILSGERAPNILQAAAQGFQAVEGIRNAPLMRELLQQRVEQGRLAPIQAQQQQELQAQRQALLQSQEQRAATQFEQQQALQTAGFANRLARQLRTAPFVDRAEIIGQNAQILRDLGVDPATLDLSDQSLDNTIAGTDAIVGGGSDITPLQAANLEIKQQELQLKKEGLNLKREELIKKAQATGKELKFSDLRGVSGDISKILQEPQKIKNSASRLAKISQTKSPTDQLAAIFTFMKALDPTSVVREGEQDQARATGGISDQFLGYVNRIKGEGALPENVFNEMVMTAKRLANQAIDDASVEVDAFIDPLSDDLPDTFIQKTRSRVPVKFKEPTAKTPAGEIKFLGFE